MWGWKVPQELHDCEDSRKVVQAKCFVAYTGTGGQLSNLVFEAVELEGVSVQGQWTSDTKWEDLRWDRETNCGTSQPRDMLFGVQVFSLTPMFRKGGLVAALERLATREWKGFENLKRLKGSDTIQQGMWIAMVRMPRAVGARNTMPYNRRKDVLQLQVDIALGGMRGERAMERLSDIRKTVDDDHPADGELRTLANGILFAKPIKYVTCTRCGAQSHHTATAHDEVYAPVETACKHEPISWLNAPPLEEEHLALPVAKEGKGFEFSMRNVTTRIPLRTARALKLMGMDIEGNIHACGVEQVKNHHIDIQTGTESCSHGKVGHKCCCCTALLAPYSKTCTHGRNSFCCCCAAVRLREDDKNLNDMLNSLE
jgi:hypothetical protein